MGSSQSIAWPATVLNTIVAESLDYMAEQLEQAAGRRPTAAKQQEAAMTVLKKVLKAHRRVIFDGDGYSEAWHKEAAKRGLPIMADSVAALPVLGARKTVTLFTKYEVLNAAEVSSRHHIAVEKYVKQLDIEAETMAALARTHILPAALEHMTTMANAVASTEAAGVDCAGEKAALGRFVAMVTACRNAIIKLEKVLTERDDDPMTHAEHMARKVRPAMEALRTAADTLEMHVAADLWPLPTYRELLFLK